MSKEFIIGDSIVACLTLSNPSFDPDNSGQESFFTALSAKLQKICTPQKDDFILSEGGTYEPVYANNEDPTTGCSWTWAEKGGGTGQLILRLVDQPEFRIRVWIQLKVSKDGSEAWLTVDYNPTTLLVGNNIHPAFVKDFDTG